MNVNQEEFTQELSKKYHVQCLQFFQEILNLQVEIELRDKKIEELEHKLAGLEEVNVDTTPHT